jgi:hypothetical protein
MPVKLELLPQQLKQLARQLRGLLLHLDQLLQAQLSSGQTFQQLKHTAIGQCGMPQLQATVCGLVHFLHLPL